MQALGSVGETGTLAMDIFLNQILMQRHVTWENPDRVNERKSCQLVNHGGNLIGKSEHTTATQRGTVQKLISFFNLKLNCVYYYMNNNDILLQIYFYKKAENFTKLPV